MPPDRSARLLERVHRAVDALRPLLPIEHCELAVVSFQESTGELVLRAVGGCPGCGMSPATLRVGIEAHLRRNVPEIRHVRLADAHLAA